MTKQEEEIRPPSMPRPPHLFAVVFAFAFLFTTGCGEKGPERAIVRGKVTHQGELIKVGTIRFMPQEGTSAPTSGGYIIDGRYTIDRLGGVPVGNHRIEVEAFRSKAIAADVDLPDAPQEQYLPETYNRKSTMTIKVPPGAGEIEHNLDLKEK